MRKCDAKWYLRLGKPAAAGVGSDDDITVALSKLLLESLGRAPVLQLLTAASVLRSAAAAAGSAVAVAVAAAPAVGVRALVLLLLLCC
jgi:uncharacterized membrane protein